MDNSVSISRAGVGDIPAICRTAEEVWPKVYASILSSEQISYMMDMMYSPSVIRQEMESSVLWLTTKVNGEITGYASFYRTTFDDISVVKLDKIYLRESIRGIGVGKALLTSVINEAKNSGASKVILNVNKYNTAAQAAYKSWGFTTAKSETNDIGNGFVMDDFVLALDI